MTAWLLYSVALATLAGLAARAAEALLSLYRRPTRWAWAGALVVSCAGPLVLAARPAAGPGEVVVGAPQLMGAQPPARAARAPTVAAQVERALPAVWAGASALLLAGIAAGVLALRARRRRWSSARLAGVPVLVSDGVGPAVVGIVRPAIVVPGWTLAWEEPMRRLVVRHEGEHIRARDPLLVLAAAVAAALVPWNPAVWWQLRRLRLAVEVDCDARTLRAGGDVATYGDLLLRVGARGSGVALPVAAFAEPRSFLERRIRAMTHRPPRNRAARAAACAALTLVVAASGYALPAPEAPAFLARADQAPSPARAVPRDTAPVLDISRVEVKPALANAAAVARAIERAYPAYQRDAGIGGIVMMQMVVREDGTASDPVAVSGNPDFSVVALELIPLFRFSPARHEGRAVPVRIHLPIAFIPPSHRGRSDMEALPFVVTRATKVDTLTAPGDSRPSYRVTVATEPMPAVGPPMAVGPTFTATVPARAIEPPPARP